VSGLRFILLPELRNWREYVLMYTGLDIAGLLIDWPYSEFDPYKS